MLFHYDIAILGGGPAGSAVALSLRKQAPELSIIIIESSAYDRQRIGETLPPTVQPLLKQLGVWETFLAEAHLPAYGTCAAWGSEQLENNEFLYSQHGRGWHLDRKRFDAMLAREAERRGVALLTSSTLKHSDKLGDEWLLTVRSVSSPTVREGFGFTVKALADARATDTNKELSISAKFVVDATGKTAAFATRHGARKQLFDQLLGAFVFFNCDAADTFTMVEACEDGWWYSALLPEAGMVAAWMSDADVIKQRSVKDPACWFEQLQKTTHTKRRLLPAEPLDVPT
ncbi:MAG: tryptophan 7-halogenase, partial [Acidobacteria bacterium]|nr:tryptophan 7-halogenase [Acidobacteriota bacterium]